VRPLKTHGKNFVVRLIKPHDKAAFAVWTAVVQLFVLHNVNKKTWQSIRRAYTELCHAVSGSRWTDQMHKNDQA
jgi:hypothetical protein